MGGLTIGSLFSGVGGLDMAVEQFFNARPAWFVEFDPAPSKVLAHRWPGVPNFGDVTTVDWNAVPRVDILTGGFPCQDLSLAGRRAGMRPGTRSGLWADYLAAIAAIKPRMVVIENVRGLLSGAAESDSDLEPGAGSVGDGHDGPVLRALGRVLGDLAGIGYDTRRCGLRAADAGAPHGRFRVFVVAYPQDTDSAARGEWWGAAPGSAESGRARADTCGRGGVPIADAGGPAFGEQPRGAFEEETGTNAGDRLADHGGERPDSHGREAWGEFWPAINRWGSVLRRDAPAPTRPDGRDGRHRLNPELTEWMMGWPAGHVTAPEIGLSRAEQLKACGNGVVPQQAYLALCTLLGRPA
ncbi:DNA cytosine methyltransferase [Mycetocola tolaasinivorans]|uniref:Cytosine-specific methyltransferase n=1 Tax=Mycetocola tolaasinivorans TaxID=76635 RepID=A0A3L6ZWZ1_9MICO|nr:DNA cytosine methyltransferase [Mycetocola tolaasinivorans]